MGDDNKTEKKITLNIIKMYHKPHGMDVQANISAAEDRSRTNLCYGIRRERRGKQFIMLIYTLF